MSGRLTEGFRNIIEMNWSEFVRLEKSEDATNFDSIVTAVARAASKSNLRAIQTSLDRLDGKIAVEIEVEYPKFFTIFPRAEKKADDPSIIELPQEIPGKLEFQSTPPGDNKPFFTGGAADMDEFAVEEEELPTGSLRAVLDKMLYSPKTIVTDIIKVSQRVDKGDMGGGDPKVKSVIVAGLLSMVHGGKMNAVFEVFDQIDGKVADKIKILGGDVYIKNFALIAPANAELNEDGIYQVVNENTTNSWATKLEEGRNAKRR